MDYEYYYRNWHDGSDEHFQRMVDAYKVFLLPYTQTIPADSRIVEIGSGVGYCLEALNQLGFSNVVGIELDKKMADKALKRGLNVINSSIQDYLTQDNVHMPTTLVLMFDVLEHVPKDDVLPLLKNIYSMLADDGVFLCQTPNCYSIAGSAFRYVDWTHVSSFSCYSFDALLHTAGFQSIRILDPAPILWPNIKQVIRNPLRAIPPFKKWIARKLFLFMLEQEVGKYNGPISANMLAIAMKD